MCYKALIIIFSILGSILSGCTANNQPDNGNALAQSRRERKSSMEGLPTFKMFNAAGENVTMESFKGKKVFVNLWASWCPPCRREMPSIEKLYQSVDTNKVAFVMLSLDDQFEKGKKYFTSKSLTIPIYYPAENLPALFSVEGIPATFIFNENGTMIKQVDGSEDYNTTYYKDLLK